MSFNRSKRCVLLLPPVRLITFCYQESCQPEKCVKCLFGGCRMVKMGRLRVDFFLISERCRDDFHPPNALSGCTRRDPGPWSIPLVDGRFDRAIQALGDSGRQVRLRSPMRTHDGNVVFPDGLRQSCCRTRSTHRHRSERGYREVHGGRCTKHATECAKRLPRSLAPFAVAQVADHPGCACKRGLGAGGGCDRRYELGRDRARR